MCISYEVSFDASYYGCNPKNDSKKKKIKSIFFGEKGYGCISLSDDCNNAIEFLNFCSKDNKFEVVFSENINH